MTRTTNARTLAELRADAHPWEILSDDWRALDAAHTAALAKLGARL